MACGQVRAAWADLHAQGVLARNVVALVEPLRKPSGEPGGVASMESALAQLSTLHVPMHLVTGNHDPVHPLYRGAQKHLGNYTEVFETVQQCARTKVGGAGASGTREHRTGPRARTSTSISCRT